MPQIRLSRFESYIESYASKADRVKMEHYPNIYLSAMPLIMISAIPATVQLIDSTTGYRNRLLEPMLRVFTRLAGAPLP